MNLCKVMQAQAKSMKAIWSSAHGGGGRGKFTSAGKPSADEKDLNTLVASAVEKVLKIRKILKVKLRTTPTYMLSLKHLNF